MKEYVSYSIAKSRFVENPIITNEQVPSKDIGDVTEKLRNDIKEEYGVNISGYIHQIKDNDIRHIFNRHGPHTKEKYPVTAKDLAEIPDIIANYDDVYIVKNNGKTGIFYKKRHNGVTFYLEAIDEDGKHLSNKQMIKVATGEIPDIKSLKEAIQNKKEQLIPYQVMQLILSPSCTSKTLKPIILLIQM